MKLMIADIDGTLTAIGKPIMPIAREALIRLRKEGVLLGIASGRPVGDQLAVHAENWKIGGQFDVIIGMNGGQMWDVRKDKHSSYHLLKKEYIKEIMDMMEPLGLNPFIYKDGYMLSQRYDEMMNSSAIRNNMPAVTADRPEQLYETDNSKILYRIPDDIKMDDVLAFIARHPSRNYISVVTTPFMVEFMDPRVNKGVAMKAFCQDNQIPLSEVMAFGDAENDVEMMKAAGWSVCLKNGRKAALEVADAVTESDVDHDGLGRYLSDHWFNKQ